MALVDFLVKALLPIEKWIYFFGKLELSGKAIQFLVACQLIKVTKLKHTRSLEDYECPCKKFQNTKQQFINSNN